MLTGFYISHAQSKAYSVKGGLTLGVQTWNNFERDPLFKYHGAVAVESADEDLLVSVYAQLGYHVKGSAIRSKNLIDAFTGNVFRAPTQEFRFENLSFSFGGKKKQTLGTFAEFYYFFGLRGDYTLRTNLDEYTETNLRVGGFFPEDQFVRKWNYGADVGGGFEFPFTDLIQGILEFSVHPDFSLQYKQPSATVWDPYTGNNRTLGERTIRNITFEISLGLRFMHIIEYID
ncbi:MAG: hypothetical protein D6714_05395 [Bacteroidetes bacterium]|nr:MAG: hypothetical protein D6714_05395 [Bacteroidota bacterium]